MSNRCLNVLLRWFDTYDDISSESQNIAWLRVLPFLMMHVACLAVLWVGWSTIAVMTAVLFYIVRMFAITAFYHRYFSHRSFKTSRITQFIFALIAATACQRGPLWWAAHHRHHHRHADTEHDNHSPQRGFWWSHMVWFLSDKHFHVDLDNVKDLQRYPELCWLDRYDTIIPIITAILIFLWGSSLQWFWPESGTNGWQMLVWAYFISTVALIHATLFINSLAHRFGKRRYQTQDDSRNNFWLALFTLGEGWHNNHHHYPGACRQGFFWWEIDFTYYMLRFMSWLGIIWDMKPVPKKMLNVRLVTNHSYRE